MKVIYGIGNVKRILKNTVLAIGVFDGLHLGHQKLIKTAVARANILNGKGYVMTFFPHPIRILRPEIYMPYIVSLPYRIKLIAGLGVTGCIVSRFTKRFAQLSPQRFIENYLMRYIRPVEVFVGDDFRFGQNRTGSVELFEQIGKKFGFKVHVVSQIKSGVGKISSTRIRELIASGRLKHAGALLGRNVSIMGIVVRGENRGKELGFPTANILPDGEILPPLGVYAVNVIIDDRSYYGMANVGCRPSFNMSDCPVNVEVHVFHFHREIYGKEIIIEFIRRIRDEKIFNTKEKLIVQLQKDEVNAKEILLAKV